MPLTSLDFAQDLTVLWAQYNRNAEDHPRIAKATLENIVSHCQYAIREGANEGYFNHNIELARSILAKF